MPVNAASCTGSLLASTVLLIACATGNLFSNFFSSASGFSRYACAVSIVGIDLSLTALALICFKPRWLEVELHEQLGLPQQGIMTVSVALALVLFLWLTIGALVLTNDASGAGFETASNGYFACWAACWTSLGNLQPSAVVRVDGAGDGAPRRPSSTGPPALSGPLSGPLSGTHVASGAASVALLLASRTVLATPAGLLALLISIATLLAALAEVLTDRVDPSGKPCLAFRAGLAVLWSMCAPWATFAGPFKDPGNGYFAVWVGAIATAARLWGDLGEVLRDAAPNAPHVERRAAKGVSV